MNKRITDRAFIALAIVTALGTSMAALPLLLDSAQALDAAGDPAAARGDEEHNRPLPSETIEARLAYAKTALKITDAQAKQWNVVADLMRKQAKDQDALITARRAHRDEQPNAIERLELRQKMMANAAARLSDLITAAQPLYATFSDDQKHLADDLLERRFSGFRGGFRH